MDANSRKRGTSEAEAAIICCACIGVAVLFMAAIIGAASRPNSISDGFRAAALEARDAVARLEEFKGSARTLEMVKFDAEKSVDAAKRSATNDRDMDALRLIDNYKSAVEGEWSNNDAAEYGAEFVKIFGAYKTEAMSCRNDIERFIEERAVGEIGNGQCSIKHKETLRSLIGESSTPASAVRQ